MIARDILRRIISLGVTAPSGSNSQPWRFCSKGDRLEVLAEPEKDHPILNYRHRGTWIAHGALIENIAIAALEFGYAVEIQEFPEPAQPNLTARLTFFPAAKPSPSALFSAIRERASNRNRFDASPLSAGEKAALLESVGADTDSVFFREGKDIAELSAALSMNDAVMLEDKIMHNLFFREIIWSEKEEREKRSGLYLKTMEFSRGQELALRLFRHWPLMRAGNIFGLARAIARGNISLYAAAGAMGIVVAEDNDGEFTRVGRTMERIWLAATTLGLGFHLVTGVLFLEQRRKSDPTVFSADHAIMIKEAYRKLADCFGVPENRVIGILFRIGHGHPPSARSSRKEPRIEFEN